MIIKSFVAIRKGWFVVTAAMLLTTGSSAASSQGDPAMERNRATTLQCVYRISHPTLGPVRGTDVIQIRFRNNSIDQAFSLRDGHTFATREPIPGAESVLKTIRAIADPTDIASMDDATERSTKAGNGSIIRILHCETDANAEIETIGMAREAFLGQHMALWQAQHPKTYRFTLDDSRMRARYPNGIELTVRDNEVVSAVDVWSLKPIKTIADLPFKTLDDVYQWISQWVENDGISGTVIDYDDRLGYPVFMKWFDSDHQTQTILIAHFQGVMR
jgi:hypothetical protein